MASARPAPIPRVPDKWSVDDGRAVEPTPGADCDSSYVLKLSRGERRAHALIEFTAPSSLTSVGIARQALAPYLTQDEPPAWLIVDQNGKSRVVPAPSPAEGGGS